MKTSYIPYRTAYTFLLVTIYAAFFVVHCYFKTSLGADVSNAFAAVSTYKKEAGSKQINVEKPAKEDNKKNNRLNKRFHPENSYLIAEGFNYEKPIYGQLQKIKVFYENPTQQRVCLSKSLRAPPVPVVI